MAGQGIYAQPRDGSTQPIFPADPDAVREQVERIVADPLFCNSKRYSGLLRFIADRSLEGRTTELKERIIGIEVFGRSPDYDTSIDATVRVAANEVRKRLALYYKEPGREQQLRIDVPSGSYVAEFRPPEPAAPLIAPQEAQVTQVPHSQPEHRSLRYFGLAAAVVIVALSAWFLPRVLAPKPLIDQFWAPMLSGAGPVVLYLSSPPGASLDATTPPPPAAAQPGELFHQFLSHRGQVPLADMNAANSLSSFLRRKGKDSTVRLARGADLAELRSAPAVLLGSYYNDWVVRLGDDMHYRFRRESVNGLRWIEDSAEPQSRKWALDLSAPYGQVGQDYVVVSRVLDQTAGRWVIEIGGLTGFGTSAACEMVTDPNAMASLGAHLPGNWAGKNLQVVLAVKLIQGSPGASQVVAAYSW